jgi:zinc protease
MAVRSTGAAHANPPLDWSAARIPAQTTRLANGLTVAAHRDPKAPLVAVYVAYRAGSREEPRGKAGLAHICEHLMYSGTVAASGSYFQPLEGAGAAWINAFVAEDYSAYFATVPVAALDCVLWMEADRMAHLGAALDRQRIDREREVVRNELRQRESAPYGYATRRLAGLTCTEGHPYAHPPDGIIEQLDGIEEHDVREWIAARHAAANAALIMVGDIETGAAFDKAQEHFGAIAHGAPGMSPAVPENDGEAARCVIEDRAVHNSRLYLAWPAPPLFAADYPAMEAAGRLLEVRLLRRLGVPAGPALEVVSELRPRQLGSQFILTISVRGASETDPIQSAVVAEIKRLAQSAIQPGELRALRLELFARLVRDLERVGGRPSKSVALGLALMVGGSADSHDRRVCALARVDVDAIAAAARRWLAVPPSSLTIRARQ